MTKPSDEMIEICQKYKDLFGNIIGDLDISFFKTQLPDADVEYDNPGYYVIQTYAKAAKLNKEVLDDLEFIAMRSSLNFEWTADALTSKKSRIARFDSELNRAMKEYTQRDAKDNTISVPTWGNTYWVDLLQFCPPYYGNQKNINTLLFSLLPNHDFHCWTIPFRGKYIITVDMLLEPLLTILNCHFAYFYRNVKESLRAKAFMLLLQFVNYILSYFCNRRTPSELPFFHFLDLKNFFACQNFTKLQIQFLMAHELGHVFLSHNDISEHKKVSFLSERLGNDLPLEIVNRDATLEYEADIFAYNFLLSTRINRTFFDASAEDTFNEKYANELRSMRTAVELLFVYLRILEKFRNKIGWGADFFGKHPRSEDRLTRLRKSHPASFHRGAIFIDFAETAANVWEELYKKTDIQDLPLDGVIAVLDEILGGEQ